MAQRLTTNGQITDESNVVSPSDSCAPTAGHFVVDCSVMPASGFVTVAWVKRRYSLPNSTLHSWKAAQRFPQTVKIGLRSVRFRVEDLRAYEASLGTDTLVIKAPAT